LLGAAGVGRLERIWGDDRGTVRCLMRCLAQGAI